MDDNQNSSTVKVLVDVLSASLQNLSEKINNIQPVLNNANTNLDKQFTEINKILFDTQSISKLLDTSISDFYNKFNAIVENLNLIKTKLDSLSQLDNTLEKCKIESKEFIKDLNNSISKLNTSLSSSVSGINTSISNLKTEIHPVIKLSNWITKPIGILIFIIGLIFASMTIINGIKTITEYFQTTTQIINQSNLSNDSNK